MSRWHTAIGLLAVAAIISPPLSAQWTVSPTPGVPRTADGRPDLTGPAPRTAEGKPDFSGIWLRGDGQLGPAGGGTLPGPAPDFSSGPPVTTFRDVGANVPGGLPLQPWAADLLKARKASNSKDNPDAHCLPMGNMQLHTHPQPRKIVQTADVIVILYEGNGGVRQLFTDGRPLPTTDPQPWWFGYSTGRWEGDALVVRSSGFRDGGWLDVNGSPLTDAATVTERFTRPNFGNLTIDITVDDPKAYTRPWTVTVNQQIMLDTELIEFVCLENEQSTKHFR